MSWVSYPQLKRDHQISLDRHLLLRYSGDDCHCPPLGRPIRTQGSGRGRQYDLDDVRKLAEFLQSYVTLEEAQREHGLLPGINRHTLVFWAREVCPLLGRTIDAVPYGRTRSRYRYLLTDLRELHATLAEKKRKKPSKGGKLIGVGEAERKYGILSSVLARWAVYCPLLGRPIRREPYGRKHVRHRYYESDIKQAVKIIVRATGGPSEDRAAARCDPETVERLERAAGEWWREGKGIRLTAAGVREAFGYDDQSLRKWRKLCSPLGRPLDVKERWLDRSDRGQGHRRTAGYLFAEMLQIEAARQRAEAVAAQPPHERADGPLTAAEVEAVRGIPAQSMRKWAREGCPVLGGKKLPHGYELRRNGKRWSREKVFFPKVLDELDAALGNAGQSDTGSMVPIGRAVMEWGIPRGTLHTFIRQLQRGRPCAALGRKLRAVKKRGRKLDGQSREIWHFHPDDLDQLARSRGIEPPVRNNGQAEQPARDRATAPKSDARTRGKGRPSKKDRDQVIRRRAKDEGLIGAHAELAKRLNGDAEFVRQFGDVNKSIVRHVLHRGRKRAQKSGVLGASRNS